MILTMDSFTTDNATNRTDRLNVIAKMKAAAEKRDIQKLAEKFINDRSEKSFNKLMKRCNWGLRSFIYSLVNNDDDTDNIMSITMEHVYFRISSFNSDMAKFSTWMYKIAYNDTITYLRSGGMNSKIKCIPIDVSEVYENMSDDDDDSSNGIDVQGEEEINNMYFDGKKFITYTKETINNDMFDASEECMEFLPDNLRIVLKERYINKKKLEQIANDNRISLSSVKNWIRKGMSELKCEIEYRHPDLVKIYEELEAEG